MTCNVRKVRWMVAVLALLWTTVAAVLPVPARANGNISVGPDGNTHLLWTNWNGAVGLWRVDTNLNLVNSKNYGPISGWTARDLSVGPDGNTHLSWTHWNGNVSHWVTDSSLDLLNSKQYGSYPGWKLATPFGSWDEE